MARQQKTKWSNFPAGNYPRNGLRWGDLDVSQRQAMLKLLSTALSHQGLKKVKEIRRGLVRFGKCKVLD